MESIPRRTLIAVVSCLLLAFLASSFTGCTRRHYRLQADEEAYCLVREKSNNPRWDFTDFNINVNPQSRYYDTFNPDRPPMPQDDPYSHEFMRCIDRKKGYCFWYRDGCRSELENPAWREALSQYVALNAAGEVELTVDSALRLAYVNSPDYQENLETIYLSALDVSTERFRFDAQFFAGNETTFRHVGPFGGSLLNPTLNRRLTLGQESNRLTTLTDAEIRKRFARGGQLIVDFANTFVWEFFGNDGNATFSLASFLITQPLLRGAGADVNLEQLTIAERGLLANLRAMERFRKGFYTDVAIGQGGVQGPTRRGGFFGGTGLTGFTGTGGGGFGGVGQATGFGRGGFGGGGGGAAGGGLAAGGAGTVGGFVGLLQVLQQIRNSEDNLERQVRTLRVLEASLEAGVIDLVQVDQFRQSIETERAVLLQSTNGLQDTLDGYKTGTLGLPPDLGLTLDDSMIEQFQFVDPEINLLEDRITAIQDQLGQLPEQPTLDMVAPMVGPIEALRVDVENYFVEIVNDLQQLDAVVPEREENMSEQQREMFRAEIAALHEGLENIRGRFAQQSAILDQLRGGLNEQTSRQTAIGLVEWVRALLNLVREFSLIQARARLEKVYVDPILIEPEQAYRVALNNRLDLMNNRAALVDSWRLVQFNADALQSVLDLTFDGDIRTTRDNPVSFDGRNGSLRVGLEFDGPFTRLVERNNYRGQLIEYAQSVRQFIQFRDGLHQSMRQILRLLNELELNLEIQRRAMAIAIRRVDSTQEELDRPVPPAEPGQPAAQLGPTAALNLLTALSDLRNTQNNFMSVWLNHYATRMLLVREMGIMQLDEQGRWIDQPIEPWLATAEQLPCEPQAIPQEYWDLVEPFPGEGEMDYRMPSPAGGPPAGPTPMAPPQQYQQDQQALMMSRLPPVNRGR